MSVFDEIQAALRERADLNARLSLIPYEGTPEIKQVNGQKYLYTRKRVGSKVTSTYVGAYSDELYQLLLRNTREARELRKQLRKLDKSLAELGYQGGELPSRVIQNLDFARANMKANIYDQAVLEGVATSFPQTEEIIDNGKVNGMTASDVQKILNLKHAWEFILDPVSRRESKAAFQSAIRLYYSNPPMIFRIRHAQSRNFVSRRLKRPSKPIYPTLQRRPRDNVS